MVHIRNLIWDTWNVTHIARHDVTAEEVEEVLNGDFILRQAKKDRLIATGKTSNGRIVSIVLADKGAGNYYVVTARPAAQKERREHTEQKGGELHEHTEPEKA